MGRGHRIGLILSAVVFAVIAFVVLRPDDDDDSTPATDTGAQTRTQGEQPGAESEPPQFDTIRIQNGQVRGGTQRISVQQGDVARIEVRSDTPDEIHLHGYDITRRVAPDDPARFRVPADIEGVFELEAHDLGHVVVGNLVVEP